MGTEFSELATVASEYASEQMTEAHQKLFARRQRLNIVLAATIGLALLLMLVVTFTLRRNFNEYVAIKESSDKMISESEDRFRKIFDNEPQCVKLFDLDRKLLDMNSAGLAIIGAPNIEEVRGQSIYDLIQPKDRQFFIDSAHALAETENPDEVQSIEFDIESLDGNRRSMQSYQVPIPVDDSSNFTILAITYDVTEKKKSEQEYRELKDAMINAGRLNTVGELASNMAHELNQPLTSTVNFAYMLDSELDKVDSPNAKKLASLILTETMRASKIVEGLRRLVDKQPSVTAWEDVNDIVIKTLPLIQDDVRQLQIKVEQYLATDLPRVKCDKVQIQQVLYNLAKNAMDAFASCHESKKKLLVIETGLTTDKKHVELSIQDTAKGIPESHIEAIFSPFVSHNENGLGMGLAIAKSIAQAHSGILEVSSTIGKGTCFKLLLPLEASTELESKTQEAAV